MLAFANVLMIINNNTPANELYKQNHLEDFKADGDYFYVQSYVGQPYIDALISTYLIIMGEFNIE